MNYRFGAVVDLETEKFQESAKKAQSEIERLEKRILELRKAKLDAVGSEIRTKLTKEISLSTIALKEQRIALREANNELRNRSAALQKAGTAQTQFRSQVGASNAVALEFNRIIQDAPFGIIGVGNNIQQLTANFAQLKATSGSTSAALKASLLSIVSPANLVLLGVSAITAAFTAYQLGAFGAKDSTDSLNDSLEKYKESLSLTNQAIIDGAKSADNEIVTLNSLKSIIEDETLSRSRRLQAVKKIQEEYPAIFGSLEREKILAADVGDAYERLTKILIARATSESAISKIVELNNQEKIILEKNADIIQRISKFEQKAAEFRAQGQEELAIIQDNQVRFLQNQNPEVKQLAIIESEREKLTNLIKVNLAEAVDITKEQNKTSNELKINEDYIANAIEFQNKLRVESLEKSKNLIAELGFEIAVLEGKLSDAIVNGSNDEIEGLTKKIQNVRNILSLIPSQIKEINVPIDYQPIQETAPELGGMTSLASLNEQISSLEKLRNVTTDPEAFKSYNEQIRVLRAELDLLSGNKSPQLLIDTFSALGSAIGNALDISNDALRGFVSTLLSNTPKIIQAILAQSRINKQVSRANVQASAQEAGADAVVIGTKAAKALGPVGLALLPVFVGGALALISNAFRGTGARVNSSAGAGAASSAVRSNAVGSSITGFGQAANPFGDLTLRTSIRGTDIELLLERVNVKSNA